MIYSYMESFFKRIHVKLIEMERKTSWLLTQTGIRPSTWSSWEKYGRIPPADRAFAIADSLGVSLEFLVAGKQTPFDLRRSNPLIAQISRHLMDLNDQQLQRVLTYVNAIRIEKANP
jgi:transcriptional regulator with XRE-family HTH domain